MGIKIEKKNENNQIRKKCSGTSQWEWARKKKNNVMTDNNDVARIQSEKNKRKNKKKKGYESKRFIHFHVHVQLRQQPY